MIQIAQLKLGLDATDEEVKLASARTLGLRVDELLSFRIRQRAIDAGAVALSFHSRFGWRWNRRRSFSIDAIETFR